MEKDFTICPHCVSKGRGRLIRPATPQRTPLVSRSDGTSYHLFVEESYVRPISGGMKFEVVALFRYDLDPEVSGDSAMAVIPVNAGDSELVQEVLEQVADKFAGTLAAGKSLRRVYWPADLPVDSGSVRRPRDFFNRQVS